MTTVAITAHVSHTKRPTDLSPVARMADDGAELYNAMSELTEFPIGAGVHFLPLVAQFCLQHALPGNLKLQ